MLIQKKKMHFTIWTHINKNKLMNKTPWIRDFILMEILFFFYVFIVCSVVVVSRDSFRGWLRVLWPTAMVLVVLWHGWMEDNDKLRNKLLIDSWQKTTGVGSELFDNFGFDGIQEIVTSIQRFICDSWHWFVEWSARSTWSMMIVTLILRDWSDQCCQFYVIDDVDLIWTTWSTWSMQSIALILHNRCDQWTQISWFGMIDAFDDVNSIWSIWFVRLKWSTWKIRSMSEARRDRCVVCNQSVWCDRLSQSTWSD